MRTLTCTRMLILVRVAMLEPRRMLMPIRGRMLIGTRMCMLVLVQLLVRTVVLELTRMLIRSRAPGRPAATPCTEPPPRDRRVCEVV